jgi:hypothetical protein
MRQLIWYQNYGETYSEASQGFSAVRVFIGVDSTYTTQPAGIEIEEPQGCTRFDADIKSMCFGSVLDINESRVKAFDGGIDVLSGFAGRAKQCLRCSVVALGNWREGE